MRNVYRSRYHWNGLYPVSRVKNFSTVSTRCELEPGTNIKSLTNDYSIGWPLDAEDTKNEQWALNNHSFNLLCSSLSSIQNGVFYAAARIVSLRNDTRLANRIRFRNWRHESWYSTQSRSMTRNVCFPFREFALTDQDANSVVNC